MGPIAGLVHAPPVGQVPMIPLAGPSHMVPAVGPAHMGLSTGFGHTVGVSDWATHTPLTGMNDVEHYQVYGDHSSQEQPPS
jgi:hypothetical protein